MPPRKVVFSNQKGGVGKTTLTREIGISLAKRGLSTLLIDTDPQANLSKSFRLDEKEGLYEAIDTNEIKIENVKENLDVLAGNIRLSLLEKNLIGEIDAYIRIKSLLAEDEFDKYDYILFDTPPSLGLMTLNSMAASEFLVIPMSPSLYSMQGTNDLIDTISKVRRNLNPDLHLLGVAINSYDKIPVITREITAEIEEALKGYVFKTYISKSIKVEESIASNKGLVHQRTNKVSAEIELLTDEIISKVGGK